MLSQVQVQSQRLETGAMTLKEITKICTGCGGTGSHTGEVPGNGDPVPYDNRCRKCGGDGRLPLGELSEDLVDFLTDLKEKVDDIYEKINE